MSRFRVITHPVVESEISEAYAFIAKHAPSNAVRWVDEIETAILSLADFPERCPIADESDDFEDKVRHLIVGNYRILFTIQKNEVHVLHVRHAARRQFDPEAN